MMWPPQRYVLFSVSDSLHTTGQKASSKGLKTYLFSLRTGKTPPKRGFLDLFCGNEALLFQAFNQRRILRAGQGSFFVNVIASYCESVCRRSQIFRLCANAVSYTHLDVYKRQAIFHMAARRRPLFFYGNVARDIFFNIIMHIFIYCLI